MKTKMKVTVCDISGMGGRGFGGYEWGCQVIALRTLRFLQQLKDGEQFPVYQQFKDVVGIAIPADPAAERLDKYILDHPGLQECGVTGAMHQFGIAHGQKLFELGREEYLHQLRESGRTEDDFYEFEEEDAFPKEDDQ